MCTGPSISDSVPHTPLRVLLALLLILGPLLSIAQPLGDGTAGGSMMTGQVPCHSDGAEPETPETHADCPHCAGDAPLTQCDCCDQAAPAGLTVVQRASESTLAGDDNRPEMLSDALPRSPGDRLYRPPIQSS